VETKVHAFLIIAGATLALIALAYAGSAASAYIRDLRGLPPNTPDLRGLSETHPNWSLWIRRVRSDPADMLASVTSGLSTLRKFVLAALLLAGILAVAAMVIYGGASVVSSLGSAPGWAIIVIVLLLIIALK
jgi:amino acid transporter